MIYAEDVNVPSGRDMMKDLLNELSSKSKDTSGKLDDKHRQE